VAADRQLAQRRAAAGADAVMQHVALGAAALHPDAKAFQLAIPEHRFGAARRHLQGVHRALGDLAAHRLCSLSADQWIGPVRGLRYHLGITENQVCGNRRQQKAAIMADLQASQQKAETSRSAGSETFNQ